MAMTSYNGVTIPGFMYGTAWKKEATTRLVLEAVKAGFTAIDTANQLIHYDETRVGEALLRLREEGVARDGLFLQTKFTPVNGQDHRTPYDVTASITTPADRMARAVMLKPCITYTRGGLPDNPAGAWRMYFRATPATGRVRFWVWVYWPPAASLPMWVEAPSRVAVAGFNTGSADR